MSYPTRLYATVRSRLAGSSQSMIEHEILDTARDICNQVAIWREELEIPQVLGTSTYAVTPATANADVVFILSAHVNDLPLRAWAGTLPMPEDRSFIDLSDNTQIVRSTASTETDPIKLVLQLRPSIASPIDIPNILQVEHYELLLDGTLARMYDHADRPYSELEKAEFHRRMFQSRLGKARAIVNRGRTMHAVPWSFPTFARGSGGRPSTGGI